MRLFFLFTVLLLTGYGATAQMLVRLSGTLRDSLTNQPLVGASVVIDYRKSLTGTTTDSLGRFGIDLTEGTHTVAVRLIGYTPVRRVITLRFDDVTLNLRMRSVATQLEEVFVTTKGYDQTVRQPLLGVNQINLKTLQKLPAALGEIDLLRGLQSLPGVTSVGEASNGVNIRGGTTDQNLILLDDTPIFNPTHMFGLFSIFPPEVLSTVDIYKGNVPARFGGRTAAVLDVAMRNPDLDRVQLSGGLNVVSSRLSVDIPIVKGKAGLLIAGRGAFTDFLLPIVSKRLTDIRAKFGDGVIKGFWRINDRNTLTAMGYVSLDVFQTPLLANLPNVTGSSTQFGHQTTNFMGRWFRTFSDKTSLQTSVI
ncbi:MAG TPA: TonB-dependent receptor, partial [Fibrella sp.]